MKVIKYLEEKRTIKATSELFNINRNTVIAWKKLNAATGDVQEHTRHQVGHGLIIKDKARFEALVAANV